MTVNDFIKALTRFLNEHPEALQYEIGRAYEDYGWGTVDSIRIEEREHDHVKVVEI